MKMVYILTGDITIRLKYKTYFKEKTTIMNNL